MRCWCWLLVIDKFALAGPHQEVWGRINRGPIAAAIAGERGRAAIGTVNDVPIAVSSQASRACSNAGNPAPVAAAWAAGNEDIQGPDHVPHGEGNAPGGAVLGISAKLLPTDAAAPRVRILDGKIRADDSTRAWAARTRFLRVCQSGHQNDGGHQGNESALHGQAPLAQRDCK